MMEEQSHFFDICIVCALYEEASAVLDEFSTRCGVTFTKAFRNLNQLEYRYATIQNRRDESLTVFVTWLSGMGPIRTALDLKPLLHEIRPRFVAMTGVCAGDKSKVKLGDLIVATYAYHPEEGKITTGASGPPIHLPETRTAGATMQVIQYVQGFDEWKAPVRELKRNHFKHSADPQCHIEVVASSMAVRSDNPFPQLVSQYNRKTVGVDMEAATVYTALHDFPLMHGLVVKGVSDYGDHTKTKTNRYRDYARRASAVYLLHFIQEYVTDETMPHLRNPHFTGRDELLDQPNQQLFSKEQWVNVGYEHYRIQRYAEALSAFEQAIHLDPQFAHAYHCKGTVCWNLKKYEEALSAFEQATHLDPQFAQAYSSKSLVLCDLRRYEEALSACEQAIDLSPKLTVAYQNKGNVLYDLKRYKEALSAYEQAIDLDPQFAEAYNGKGNVLYYLRRYEEALSAYEQAIDLDPQFAEAYNGKSSVLEHLGKHTEAKQAYEKARQLGVNHYQNRKESPSSAGRKLG